MVKVTKPATGRVTKAQVTKAKAKPKTSAVVRTVKAAKASATQKAKPASAAAKKAAAKVIRVVVAPPANTTAPVSSAHVGSVGESSPGNRSIAFAPEFRSALRSFPGGEARFVQLLDQYGSAWHTTDDDVKNIKSLIGRAVGLRSDFVIESYGVSALEPKYYRGKGVSIKKGDEQIWLNFEENRILYQTEAYGTGPRGITSDLTPTFLRNNPSWRAGHAAA